MIRKNGQTLVMLLVFSAISMIVSTAAVMMTIINTKTTTKFQQSTNTVYIAESGVENAILQLLRNPSYSGETLIVEEGDATVSVIDVGNDQKQIISIGKNGDFLRKLQVIINYSGNILTIVSWKEI